MTRKKPRFVIEVNSFTYIGALNAEHYYGKIWWRSKDSKTGVETHELQQPMSSKMAAYLNKKDESFHSRHGYKKGDLTNRFDTEEQVVKAGIEFLLNKFGGKIVIEEGDWASCDNKIVYPKNRTS